MIVLSRSPNYLLNPTGCISAQYSSLSSFDSVPLVIISWSLGFQILKIKLYDIDSLKDIIYIYRMICFDVFKFLKID